MSIYHKDKLRIITNYLIKNSEYDMSRSPEERNKLYDQLAQYIDNDSSEFIGQFIYLMYMINYRSSEQTFYYDLSQNFIFEVREILYRLIKTKEILNEIILYDIA